MDAVVFGASGGLGAAFVDQLRSRDDVGTVHAVSRAGETGGGGVVSHACDITQEDEIAAVAAAIKATGAPSLVIVATGILSDGEALQPEKTYRHHSMDAFERIFRINTFGPRLVAKHMLPIMPRNDRAVFAALSARVGSISDNRVGGWHAYRASKAALNMLIRNYAIEQGRRNNEFIAVALHPGTVDTGLSEPFQSGVPEALLFTPDVAAGHLLSVIDGLTPEMSGGAYDWAGKAIPA